MLLAFKVRLLLNDWEVPDSQSLDWVRLAAAPVLGWAFLSFGCLTPLAAIALFRKDPRPFWQFVAATTVAGLGSTAVFFVIGRYRVPWSPGLALLAAAGAVDIARRFAARAWGQVARRALLVGAPVAGLASWPVTDPDAQRWGYLHTGLFVAYLHQDDLHKAIDVLDDARATDPRSPAEFEVRNPGGVHDLLKAAVSRRWVALPPDPGTALARARLARVIPEVHAFSRDLLDEAERVQPDNPALWRERGGWWLAVPKDTAERRHRAIEAYRRAPHDPSTRITLALLTSDARLLDLPIGTETERVRIARALIARRQTQRRERGP